MQPSGIQRAEREQDHSAQSGVSAEDVAPHDEAADNAERVVDSLCCKTVS